MQTENKKDTHGCSFFSLSIAFSIYIWYNYYNYISLWVCVEKQSHPTFLTLQKEAVL